MEHRTETFKVKDGATVTHEVAWTIHGPVIAWDAENGTAYAQRMGVHGRELDTWVAFAEMGRAKSLAEFREKGVDRLGWNLGACYGGEDGTIAYFEAGALPKKAGSKAAPSGSTSIARSIPPCPSPRTSRSEEHTSEIQSIMGTSYDVFRL